MRTRENIPATLTQTSARKGDVLMSEYYGHNENKPTKEVLEESIKKIKCPLCGYETEPYYMKLHNCSEGEKS